MCFTWKCFANSELKKRCQGQGSMDAIQFMAGEKSKSSELLAFCSTWDFCSHWARLRTPALSFDRCAAPLSLCFPWPVVGKQARPEHAKNSDFWLNCALPHLLIFISVFLFCLILTILRWSSWELNVLSSLRSKEVRTEKRDCNISFVFLRVLNSILCLLPQKGKD